MMLSLPLCVSLKFYAYAAQLQRPLGMKTLLSVGSED